MPATPSKPEPSRRMLLGSGTELAVVVVFPDTVKASDGIEPTEFSEACEGPEFSSQ